MKLKTQVLLKVVHSSPLQNTVLRISQAIQDDPNKGFKIKNQTLILSLGMGQDRKQRTITISMPEAHLLKDQTVRNLRIVFELGTYSAVFTVQKQLPI